MPIPLLDGIGTGDTCDTQGSNALALAASESRARRGFFVDVDGDPFLWTDGAFNADWSHQCERPFTMMARGRPYAVATGDIFVERVIVNDTPTAAIKLPCRKCWPCQKARRRVWIARAVNECRLAPNNWFFTGTFREAPDSPDVVVDEYQRYLKRLRKAGHQFRYLAVLERGEKNGRLHVHILFHAHGMSWNDIHDGWTAGFATCKGVKARFDADGIMDQDSARQVMYVAGYVTGEIEFKIRNSFNYGRMPLPSAPITPARTGGGDAISPAGEASPQTK